MADCEKCQQPIDDNVVLTRAAELGWLHPEEVDAAVEERTRAILGCLQEKGV